MATTTTVAYDVLIEDYNTNKTSGDTGSSADAAAIRLRSVDAALERVAVGRALAPDLD